MSEIINIRGKDVEIDKLCVPLVKFFNEIGLHTKFCCEGHKPNESFMIMFEDYMDDATMVKFIESYSNKHDHTPFLGRFDKWYRKMNGDIVSSWMYVTDDKIKAEVDYQRMVNNQFLIK